MSTQSAEWILSSRVLRRIGFGARGSEVDSAVSFGDPSAVVSEMLNADFANDPGVRGTPMPQLDVLRRPEKSDAPGFRQYIAERRQQKRALTHWWIARMAAAKNPAKEKLTFLWHNHFATSAVKINTARTMANQNQQLRELCLGDFQKLAYAMLTDTAMILWLDGQLNQARSPNENLAREFLELFALGHGNGYSEKDVREGARALTGWTIREDVGTKLIPNRHDNSKKTILGTTGRLGAEEFCEIVVSRPESASFIAGRMWQQLASDEPPTDATLKRLVKAYGRDRDLRALTAAVLTDPVFLGSRASMVTGPTDWLIGVLRAVQTPLNEARQIQPVAKALKALGQLPFYPPDVGGWPNGQAWLSSSAVNIRLRIAGEVVKAGDISLVAEAPHRDRLDAAGYLIGVGAWSERSAKALKPLQRDPDALVSAAVNTPEYLTV